MQSELSFEVIVRRKIPYVTAFFFCLLVAFVFIFLLVDLFFLPARQSSDEIKVAYFIVATPDFVKTALVYSSIGFIIVLPLYISVRLYRKAVLSFLPDTIVIQGNKINIDLPIKELSKVYCMDSHSLSGESREKLTIYLQQKGEKTIRVRLRNYLQAEAFMDRLMQYDNLDLKAYDFNVSVDPMNEE
jgi:hypothetical protein